MNRGVAGPKVESMNCNGLGKRNKRNKVLTWLKNKPENTILELENEWKKMCDGELYFSHGASNSTGVVIIIKNNEDFTVNKVRNICQGRVLLVELTIEAVKYCVVDIYSPNNDDHEFIENVF